MRPGPSSSFRSPARRAVRATAFLSAAVALAASVVGPAFAQVARWVELPPPPLAGAAAVYDPARDRMLTFGGSTDAHGRGTIWSLPLPGAAWKELAFDGDMPPVQPQAVVYDPVADRAVAFIGPNPGLNAAAVFTLDLSAATLAWSELATTGTLPTARAYYSAIYDPPRQRMLVFGGYVSGSISPVYANKVWALSLTGTPDWTELAVQGTPPAGRGGQTAIYDPAHDRMVIHGGFSPLSHPIGSTQALDETWALSLSGTPAWTFLPPASAVPPARTGHSAALDSAGGRMVVFGGSTTSGVLFQDAWYLDLTASTSSAVWTQQALDASPHPSARREAGACWDAPRGRFLIQGGSQPQGSETVKAADTWALLPGGNPPWTALTPNVLAPPGVRDHAAALDSAGDRLFVFCGVNSAGDQSPSTWERSLADGSGWLLVTSSGPGSRQGPMAAADAAGDRALLFGGYHYPPATYLGDVMGLDFGSEAWSPLPADPSPPGRAGGISVFDAARRRFVLYGGDYSDVSGNTYLEDTWAYDAAAGTWQALTSAGSFGQRRDAAAIYDPVGDRMVVFGGADPAVQYNDLHVLPLGPGGVWAPLGASGTPPPAAPGMVAGYDAAGGRMIVFGTADDAPAGEDGITAWALTLATPVAWSRLSPQGRIPLDRHGESAVSDFRRGRILLHGGATSEILNETWAFHPDETTPTQLSLVQADATPDCVRIRWYAAEGAGLGVDVQRRAGTGPWASLARLRPDGRGEIAYEDRDVRPGQSLTYRLGVVEDGVERYYGEVSVTIPLVSALRLFGARPNPVERDLNVAFELAAGSPARLELMDLAGRRVLARDLAGFGAGRHTLALAPAGGRLAAGLYFLRLSQAGGSLTRRVVVAR